MTLGAQPGNWVASVQGFVRGRKVSAHEQCDICSSAIAPDHPHLVEPAKRRLLCVCRGCAMLLGNRADDKYRQVPGRAWRLESFQMTDAEWDAFAIPIGLAFFVQSTTEGRILAFYPGPAGPTESLLDLCAWEQLVARNPALAELEPDVEALLVNRVNHAREYYRAPIDRCYELVGLIRTNWRGLSGGEEAWTAINGFFAGLRDQAAHPGARGHG
jgi:hypothetical protein